MLYRRSPSPKDSVSGSMVDKELPVNAAIKNPEVTSQYRVSINPAEIQKAENVTTAARKRIEKYLKK
jgi:hypothetical protein